MDDIVRNNLKNIKSLSLILKCTRNCNLRCKYCMDWKKKSFGNFDIEQIAAFFKDLNSIDNLSHINFIWHGGEPLLLGIPFYRKVFFIQNQIFRKIKFKNTLQTNGSLITSDWANHFKEYNFYIGVSLDGTEKTHNENRTFSNGKGSYTETIKGISILKEHNVKFGVLTVISDEILHLGAHKLINSYLEKDIYNSAFLSIRKNWSNNKDALNYNKRFGHFISNAILYWLKEDNTKNSIRELDSKLDLLFNLPGRVCKDCGACVGKYFGIEASGDIFHCDKFLTDNRFFFGNVRETSIKSILTSEKLRKAVKIEMDIRRKCNICKWFNICKGGCLSDLITLDDIGGKRGTEECLNFQMYEFISDSVANYLIEYH